MKFSLEWLSEYVDPGPDPAAVGTVLTAVGIPLDSLERAGDDTVFDFDVTTNRPDCMNHVGLAREIAAATGRDLQEPAGEIPPADSPARHSPAKQVASVEVEARDLCGRYTALVIQRVKVGPSPAWLTRRLGAIGLRPINSVVDATNYVLWEMGHPLHAFDLARLSGRKIRVRRAKAGEPLVTLDGIARELDPETLVIADDLRAVVVAGVMGGRDSEISGSTTEVLLESAHFQPAAVRRAARKLALHTDASHRFERGTDLEATLKAAARCARLIAEVAGGTVLPEVLEARSAPPFRRTLDLRPERVRRLLGLSVPEKEMRAILERLGCAVDEGDPARWRVSTPSFRGDLGIEEDLVEEIARHHGYDKIPTTLPRVWVFPEGRPENEKRIARIRAAMTDGGFTEALNLSLVTQEENASLGGDGDGLKIANPLVEGQDRMRTSLLPGLLRNLAHNLNHGSSEVRLFETGKVFREGPGTGDLPDEEETLSLACGGKGGPKHWSDPLRPPDLFDLTGVLEVAARRVGLLSLAFAPATRRFLAPGTGAEVRVGGKAVGLAGELERSLRSSWGLEDPAFVAEISLRRLFAAIPPGFVPRHAPLSRTPAVSRDLSLILDRRHSYAEVEEVLRSVEGAPIARIRLFDRYQGDPVPEGKVSLAVNIVLQSRERTLVSGEISEILDRIVQRLRERLGAVLRGQ